MVDHRVGIDSPLLNCHSGKLEEAVLSQRSFQIEPSLLPEPNYKEGDIHEKNYLFAGSRAACASRLRRGTDDSDYYDDHTTSDNNRPGPGGRGDQDSTGSSR